MRHTLRYTVLLLGIGMTLAIGWPAGVQGLTQQAVGFYMAGGGKGTVGPVGQPGAVLGELEGRGDFKDVVEKQGGSPAEGLFDGDKNPAGGGNNQGEVNEGLH